MLLELAYYGDPILRKKGEPVEEITEELRHLVKNMVDTLIEHNGIGLAAPQIQRSIQLFITAVPIEHPNGDWEPGTLRVFINPKIITVSDEKKIRSEGCLSIPTVNGDVIRPKKVKVRATDLYGKEFEEEFKGLEARCIMHENDHINGVLFLDRMDKISRKKLDKQLREVKKKYYLKK